MEVAVKLFLATVKSPKSTASPSVIIVTIFIVLTLAGPTTPPPVTALTEFEQPAGVSVAAVKSPKLTASPVVLNVTYSIVLTFPGSAPPKNNPLIGLEAP